MGYFVWFVVVGACQKEPADPRDTDESSPSDTSASTNPTSDLCAGTDAPHGTGTVPGHIHNVALWGCTGEVILGTHEGTWRTEAGATELVQLAPEGDFMGLVQDPFEDWRYYGSGHFHEERVGNSGFLESLDGGETWSSISLAGETDFHQIATSPERPCLLAGAHESTFYVSEDAGRSWEEHFGGPFETTGMVLADPEGPVLLYASDEGISRRTLPEFTTELLVEAEVTGMDRHGEGIAYATASGEVYLCDLELTDCASVQSPSADDPVVAFLFGDDLASAWVVTEGSGVWYTPDLGVADWQLVVSQDESHTHR